MFIKKHINKIFFALLVCCAPTLCSIDTKMEPLGYTPLFSAAEGIVETGLRTGNLVRLKAQEAWHTRNNKLSHSNPYTQRVSQEAILLKKAGLSTGASVLLDTVLISSFLAAW